MTAPDLGTAIAANVALCATVLAVHGRQARRRGDLVLFGHRALPAYPLAITLAPRLGPSEIRRLSALPPGAGVKDSFGTLDLTAAGFDRLMTATWIGRGPAPAGPALPQVAAEELDAWSRAWGPDPEEAAARANFVPALLGRPDISLHALHEGGRIVGGGILNPGPARASGISNVFAPPGRLGEVVACLAAAAPGRGLAGYEAEPAPYLEIGFAALGPLAVWIRRAG